jgi:hypothetical protein
MKTMQSSTMFLILSSLSYQFVSSKFISKYVCNFYAIAKNLTSRTTTRDLSAGRPKRMKTDRMDRRGSAHGRCLYMCTHILVHMTIIEDKIYVYATNNELFHNFHEKFTTQIKT